MNSFERKMILVLSAIFIALSAVNLYLRTKNQIHLKLVDSSIQAAK